MLYFYLIVALVIAGFVIRNLSEEKQYFSILESTNKFEKELNTYYRILKKLKSERNEIISLNNVNEIEYKEEEIRKYNRKIEDLSKIIIGNKSFLRNSKYNKGRVL